MMFSELLSNFSGHQTLLPLLLYLFPPVCLPPVITRYFHITYPLPFTFIHFNDHSEVHDIQLLNHLLCIAFIHVHVCVLFSCLHRSFIPQHDSSKKYWLSPFDMRCVVLLSPSLQDVQIVSTDENQVFLALQEWYQSDTYNLYQSDPQGVYYSIILENVRSTKQPEENVLIDILEVRQSGGAGTWAQSPLSRRFLDADWLTI